MYLALCVCVCVSLTRECPPLSSNVNVKVSKQIMNATEYSVKEQKCSLDGGRR